MSIRDVEEVHHRCFTPEILRTCSLTAKDLPNLNKYGKNSISEPARVDQNLIEPSFERVEAIAPKVEFPKHVSQRLFLPVFELQNKNPLQ